jgi:DNA repair protein RadC
MIYAGNIVGVNVIDHLVIGEAPAYVSLRYIASQRGESL